ncbi:MAG: hypothetical protein IJA72_01625 [Clostridia bacterium]|nr:hypothetical protein [Clostridia bacterium]
MTRCNECYFNANNLKINYCGYYNISDYEEPYDCRAFTEIDNCILTAPILNKIYKETNGVFGQHITCEFCKHYIGGGDWNLCCDLRYDLCYEDTDACYKYEKDEK